MSRLQDYTTTAGTRKNRRARNRRFHGVQRTRRSEKVAAVSARNVRKTALVRPWLWRAMRSHGRWNELYPGTRNMAGEAMTPVKASTGIQTRVASKARETRERRASSRHNPKRIKQRPNSMHGNGCHDQRADAG